MQIKISESTHTKLQGVAKPLEDTHDSVIARLLDHYVESFKLSIGSGDSEKRRLSETLRFGPENTPSMAYTTLVSVLLNGSALSKAECYWNPLLARVIAEAARNGIAEDVIFDCLQINKCKGSRTDNGFKFVKEANLSFQNQNSINAFSQILRIAQKANFTMKLEIRWQDNEGSAHPNRTATFEM